MIAKRKKPSKAHPKMSRRSKVGFQGKSKWWYKVATMPEHRYSRKLFVQEWNVKPRRGRQRKYWCKVVDHLFSSLGLDKAE